MAHSLNKTPGARRNLNDSFNASIESPAQNYSIIDVEEENPLLIKLRKSARRSLHVGNNKLKDGELNVDEDDLVICIDDIPNGSPDKSISDLGLSLLDKLHILDKRNPYIPLEKLNLKSLSPKTGQSKRVNGQDKKFNEDNLSLRRSSRKVQRVSYIDLISPVKTPRKNRKANIDDDAFALNYSESSSPMKKAKQTPKKNTNEYKTPQKNRLKGLSKDASLSDSKNGRKTANRVREGSDYSKINHSTPTENLEAQNLETGTAKRNVNSRIQSCILDNEESPKKKRKNGNCVEPDNKFINNMEDAADMRTPTKGNQNRDRTQTPKSAMKYTPSLKAKLIREGVITPSVKMRATPIKSDGTPLNKAREKLHVSYLPKVLPCRENEYNNIFSFLEGKLCDGCGGCMYISGVPGTGKTATVTDVIRKLEQKSEKGVLPSFQFISVNGMKLSEPRQSYVEILKQLTGKTLSWEQAQSTLDTKFTSSKKSKPIILLVDELDILCTKRQDVVYNLLDWPTRACVQLIVVTIANTMDLPERLLMGRVTSRLGLTRLTFQAYTHKQLQEIVTMRLMGTKVFNPDAVQLVARKVASVSGDARRALDICRRAAEIAELDGLNTLVSMSHVNEALNAMITQPKVKAIKYCSRLQQLILQAVVAEVERTGVEETTFSNIYTMLESVAAIDGFQKVSCTIALSAVSKLGACRLLLTDQKPNDFHQKIILNVSADDVYYALRKD